MRFRLTREEIAALENAVNDYLTSPHGDRAANNRMSVLRACGVDVPHRSDTRKRPPRSAEFREAAAARLRKLWQESPEFRAARAEAARAYWQSRKADAQ